MVKVFKYANSLIINTLYNTFPDKLLGQTINYYLVAEEEINKDDKTNRVIRVNDCVLICPYGSLNGESLFNFLKKFLELKNIKFIDLRHGNVPVNILSTLQDVLPRIGTRSESQCGGMTQDSTGIDKGISPLVYALNKWDGVKTFSSCEGHQNDAETVNMYVLFTIENLNQLSALSKSLETNLNIIHDRYYNMKDVRLLFDYGHWDNIKCVYFEIRIIYYLLQQDKLFNAIKELSKLMINDL